MSSAVFAEQDYVKRPQDYLALFRRRFLMMVVPAIIVFAAVVAVVYLLPSIYRSTATVLIEEPEIPPDLIPTTVTSYAEQRLQVIKQRVMTTKNLSEIINRYKLYEEMRKVDPLSVVIERFRDDIALETVSARVINPRSGRAVTATIAFTLSYDSVSPSLAQKIVNEMLTLFLSENIRDRQNQASETTKFLRQESERLAAEVSKLEAGIAKFKQENAGRLPEQYQANLSAMEATRRAIIAVENRIEIVQDRRSYLLAELAKLDPFRPGSKENPDQASPQERLRTLRIARSKLLSAYGAAHPDVVRLERQIATLEGEIGKLYDPDAISRRLEDANRDLASAKERFSPDHPEIGRLMREIEQLRIDLEVAKANGGDGAEPTRETSNPAYVIVKQQLNDVRALLKSLASQTKILKDRLTVYEKRVNEAPQIEREYQTLLRDYDNTREQYRATRSKQLAAEQSQSLETERKSERFSLIEPPQVPSLPVKPKKPLIIGIGAFVAIAFGIALVLLLDALDDRIYGVRELAFVVGEPPLVAVPRIKTQVEKVRRVALLSALGTAAAGAIVVGLVVVHLYVQPLDIYWYSMLRKLNAIQMSIR